VNVVATLVVLLLRRDVRQLGLAPRLDAAEEADARYRSWGNLAVFALAIPVAYALGGHAPWVLILLFVPPRAGRWLARVRSA
jgi:hypothetical protein